MRNSLQISPHGLRNPSDNKYLAKYECKRCDIKWKLRNSSGKPKPCDQCRAITYPYKKAEIKYLATYTCDGCGNTWESKCTEKESKSPGTCKICHNEVLPKTELLRPRRMFGEFYCENCNNTWKSGNAWEGTGQQCNMCMEMILPASLRPLRRSGGPRGPPHREDLCGMCKKLGHNCRGYNPTDHHDDDDDQSVRSFGSFTTDRSGGGGDDITPTASDDEDTISEMLATKINKLGLK